jgi:hypothetical protein
MVEIEARLVALLESARGLGVPPDRLEDSISLAKAGEPGVALENFCSNLDDHEIAVSPGMLAAITELGTALHLDEKHWNRLGTNRALPPTPAALRYGAVREAIVAAASTARLGFGETRAWDSLADYIISDGTGCLGVVRFDWNGCVAAFTSSNPWRELDVASAIASAPELHRQNLRDVCRLPLLAESNHPGITTLFWSDGGPLAGPDAWPTTYAYGGDLLHREALDDQRWTGEATEYWAVEVEALSVIVATARRRVGTVGPMAISAADYHCIVPADAPHRIDAVELLRSLGITIAVDR